MKRATLLAFLFVGVLWLPLAEAKDQTVQGIAYIDGSTVQDGTSIRAYANGALIANATTPVTTQGTYRLHLTNVQDGATITFDYYRNGITWPAEVGTTNPSMAHTLSTSDPEPITITLNAHQDVVSGVATLEGVPANGKIVRAVIGQTPVAATTTGSDGTYVLQVPGRGGDIVVFTVDKVRVDGHLVLQGGRVLAKDLSAVNHPPSLQIVTMPAYTANGGSSWDFRSSDLDHLANDVGTITVNWGDGTTSTAQAQPNESVAITHDFPDPDKQYSVSAAVTDANGATSVTASATVKYDAQPPSTIASLSQPNGDNGWHKGAASSITLTSTDPALSNAPGSGVQRREYRQDNTSSFVTYESPISLQEGVHALNYRAVDNAGNTEVTKHLAYKYDASAPTSSVDALAAFTTQPVVTLTWNPADAVSGWSTGTLWYKKDAEPWATWLTGVTNTSATFDTRNHGGDGTYQFYLQGADAAGNQRAAPASGDAGTLVNTAAAATIVTPNTPPDNDEGWTNRLTMNLTSTLGGAPSNGTITYAWNPNITEVAWGQYQYEVGGPGLMLLAPYGCSVLGYSSQINGVTEPAGYYSVCVLNPVDKSPVWGAEQNLTNLIEGQTSTIINHTSAIQSNQAEAETRFNATMESLRSFIRNGTTGVEVNLTTILVNRSSYFGELANQSAGSLNASIMEFRNATLSIEEFNEWRQSDWEDAYFKINATNGGTAWLVASVNATSKVDVETLGQVQALNQSVSSGNQANSEALGASYVLQRIGLEFVVWLGVGLITFLIAQTWFLLRRLKRNGAATQGAETAARLWTNFARSKNAWLPGKPWQQLRLIARRPRPRAR